MKKLIILAIMLMAVSVGAETSKYGSMWKQEDRTISPADDVIYVDFTGYTTIGAGGGSPFTNITVTGVAVIEKLTGGTDSINSGTYSGVFSGYSNIATGDYSVVSGGNGNKTVGLYSFIASGLNNLADTDHSFVGTGGGNWASGLYSFIGSGVGNEVQGAYGFIGSGSNHGITGSNSVIFNGFNNEVAGDFSNAMGKNVVITATGDRVFADIYQSSGSAEITIPNVHIIYGNAGFEKKVGINILAPDDTLDVVGTAQITGDVQFDSGIFFTGKVTTYDNYSVSVSDYTVFAHATSTAKDMYLPDATATDGMHIRFKKKDITNNHITINATGGQNIDGNGSKVLEQTDNAITLYSNGSNWEVLQATPVAHYGEMHLHDNSTATVIDTANIPHLMQGLFAEEDTEGFDFVAGSTGPISAFAEYSTVVSGTTKVTDVGHGLSSGAILSISGTTSYNGVFEATVIDVDNYHIVNTFVADDATGNWYEGDKLVNATGKTGKYRVEFHGFGTPETNNDILEFHLYKDAVIMENLESKRKFAGAGDVGAISASGLISVVDGEAITLSIINTSGTGDFTMEHVNIVVHSF